MLLHMGMLCGSRMQKKYILLTSGKKVHFASLCLESCHPPRVVYAVDKFVPRRLVVLLLWQPVTHLNFICLWDQTRRKLAMHVIVNMIPVSAEIACVRPAWESSRTQKRKRCGHNGPPKHEREKTGAQPISFARNLHFSKKPAACSCVSFVDDRRRLSSTPLSFLLTFRRTVNYLPA